jgi:hypothetical protein
MANGNKFLDQKGIEYLWSKISMEDYPNNETLIAVLTAIDETKADKETLNTRIPAASASDNGKFLRVVNGVAAWTKVPNAEEASF